MKNIYDTTYLKLINEWNNLFQQKVLQSKTDYTPDEFVNKIFDDIKAKGLDQDFVLEYTLDDFKKYVNKQNFQYYDEFIKKFRGKDNYNFGIVILNYEIFNNDILNKKIEEYISKVDNLKKDNIQEKYKLDPREKYRIKRQLKENFNSIFNQSANIKSAINLVKSLKNKNGIGQDVLIDSINSFYRPKLILKNTDNTNISMKDLFWQDLLQQLNTFNIQKNKKNKYEGDAYNQKVRQHQTTCGYCQNFKSMTTDCDGFLYFINRNLADKNDLRGLFMLINHEVDHYFQTSIKDTGNETGKQSDRVDKDSKDIIKKKSISTDKEFLYYLFERSEFNSRGTDLCNLLLQYICPIFKKDSMNKCLMKYIEKLKAAKTEKELMPIFAEFNTSLKQQPKYNDLIDTPLYFAAVTYKLFPDTKWKELKERLDKDFKQYESLTPQQQQKYADQVAAHMKPHSKKAEQALKKMQTASPKQQKRIQNAAAKIQQQQS